VNQPRRATAVLLTLGTAVAITEMTVTTLCLPWPHLSIVLAGVAVFLAFVAGAEWADLTAHRNPPEQQ
jgi:hypothetical protein